MAPPATGFTVERPRHKAGPFPISGQYPASVSETLSNQRGAAFIDLDRTLLTGASGPILNAALRAAGVIGSTKSPVEDVLFRVFNVIGETLPSMLLARQGVTLMKGKQRHHVVAAAAQATDELLGLVQPFANSIIESHRAQGRKVILATTTPHDFIATFARRAGFDDVVATRFVVGSDGSYTGKLDGPFVWSAGKLGAIEAWAALHDVSLSESYAYSDSIYDAPLLGAVGHPVAVNPDARLMVMAAARRWPIMNFDVLPGVAKVPVIGMELQKLGLLFARSELFPFARFNITGAELIASQGPAIIVSNHRSYFDVLAIAMAVAKTGRTVRFLGKKEVFDAPLIGQFAAAIGGIRVDRASGSEEPLAAAANALAAGEMVAIMPQGTIPRGRAFFDPVLRGRWGAARLALMTGAPVFPVGLWGTEVVWPRNARLPNFLQVTNPPKVSITVGPQVALNNEGAPDDLADENTIRIMNAISALLPAQARQDYEPTPDELKRTFPSGYSGDIEAEFARRPGTD